MCTLALARPFCNFVHEFNFARGLAEIQPTRDEISGVTMQTIPALPLIAFLLFLWPSSLQAQSHESLVTAKSNQYVYVTSATERVTIKYAGQDDWVVIQKFAAVLPGDSLRVPQGAVVLLGDGSSPWRRITGLKTMIIPTAQSKRNRFGRYLDHLCRTFWVERQARRFSRAGVRGPESLHLAMPDTVVGHSMPERLQWIKNVPWWMAFRVQVTHDQKTVLDTVVTGQTLSLNDTAQFWQRPGDYQVKVTFSKTELDSCIVSLLPENQAAVMRSEWNELKKQEAKRAQREDYLALVDFCLQKKLYFDLEQALVRMNKRFPNDPEAQAMLYAYYASFLPEETAERYLLHHFK